MAQDPSKESILDTLIVDIPQLSAEFKQRTADMGFRSLREITDGNKRVLHAHPLFSFRWRSELLQFLNLYDLVELMNNMGEEDENNEF